MYCSLRLIVQTLVFSHSYLHRQVSPRDPTSGRRNYLGEKWPLIWTEISDIHAYTFGFFYLPQICDMGQTALLPIRRKACWGFFPPCKIQRLRPGLNQRTWGVQNMLFNWPTFRASIRTLSSHCSPLLCLAQRCSILHVLLLTDSIPHDTFQ